MKSSVQAHKQDTCA